MGDDKHLDQHLCSLPDEEDANPPDVIKEESTGAIAAMFADPSIDVFIFILLAQYVHWLLPVSPQCTALLDITTTPVPTAVSAAQPEPTSLSLGRTTASLAPGTPPRTLTVPPTSPTAKVMLLITFSLIQSD